jgi:hypothetical protein
MKHRLGITVEDEPVAWTSNGEPPPESTFDFEKLALSVGVGSAAAGESDGSISIEGAAEVWKVVGTEVSMAIASDDVGVLSGVETSSSVEV